MISIFHRVQADALFTQMIQFGQGKMPTRNDYLETLRSTVDYEAYLLEKSNLPGPRANLELADAAASIATREQIFQLLAHPPKAAAQPSAEEFLPVCGTIALGYELCRGNEGVIPLLFQQADDPRWRVRESTSIALQIYGDSDIKKMLEIVRAFARGTLYQKRAAAAAICEPRLLRRREYALAALDVLDEITQAIPACADRSAEDFKTLRKGMAYCWSVVVAALPEEGKRRFEAWICQPDRDLRWILLENLKKNRLIKMDPNWVKQMNLILLNNLGADND